jgi:hypothetical protein
MLAEDGDGSSASASTSTCPTFKLLPEAITLCIHSSGPVAQQLFEDATRAENISVTILYRHLTFT